MKDDSKFKIRDGLSDLLNDLPDEVPGLDTAPALQKIKTDTQNIQMIKAKNKAKNVMKNLLSFYLSQEIIDEHEYIRAKAELDEYALSMLIRQMQNSETAISSLMDTIEEGDAAPRIYELLSDLQRTLLDIIKSQTMYMIAIEENAKKMSRDIDVYNESSSPKQQTKQGNQSGLKARGTKELMKALQNSITEENIQDVEGD